jgi:hypothetical protein
VSPRDNDHSDTERPLDIPDETDLIGLELVGTFPNTMPPECMNDAIKAQIRMERLQRERGRLSAEKRTKGDGLN